MGGHLARLRDGLNGALAESIVALVIGAAAAIASGRPDAGLAVIAGGAQFAERGILRYSRELESAADQAGLTLLDRTGQSARGLEEFLDVLADQELLATGRQDPYVRTHPISRERLEFVQNFNQTARFANTPLKPDFVAMHARMRAKLIGYLEPAKAFRFYPENSQTVEARYAQAIAYSRLPDYPRALALMDSLISEQPSDAYFLDTKAQMLFEAGRPAEALPLLEAAAKLLPDAPLIRIALAQAQLEIGTPALNKAAIANLESARLRENENRELLRMLSVAYGRDGQLGMVALAQAERALLSGRRTEARVLAERAERQLAAGSSGWLRAQDIRQATRKPGSTN
jgi:predicted Zn-dependent protease